MSHTDLSLTQDLASIPLRQAPRYWRRSLLVAVVLCALLFTSIIYLIVRGVGIWGINVPVGWGMDISNFVWWIGIGHTGSLISAVLLLFRQRWRTSINRLAEAMTVFALISGSLFPLLHMGRPWFSYWMAPYPSTLALWPQFRSSLVWDFVAIAVYGLVTLMFFYVGLIPDLATLRDRTRRRSEQVVYGLLALGWRGSARQWQLHEMVYYLMAVVVVLLVVSVHSITSWDFATAIVPGWHSTIFPPYFVAAALYSGLGLLAVMAVLLRAIFRLHDFITEQHWRNLAKMLLASSALLAYSYLSENFMAWYSGRGFVQAVAARRLLGDLAPLYWLLLAGAVVVPQVFWFRRARASLPVVFVVGVVAVAIMWLERYISVITSLEQDFLPSAWRSYTPTFWDWSMLAGSFGLFLLMLLAFVRFLPVIAVFEMRELVAEDMMYAGETDVGE